MNKASYLNGKLEIKHENGEITTEFHKNGIFSIGEFNHFEAENSSGTLYRRKSPLNMTNESWNMKIYYEGELSFGEFEGKGKFYSSIGDCYEGEWLNGDLIGVAKQYCQNGNVVEGKWSNGNFTGLTNLTTPKGENKLCRNIKGNRIILNHFWSDEGTIEYKNGDVYVGTLMNKKYKKVGVLTLKDGTQIEGKWEYDDQTYTDPLLNLYGNFRIKFKSGIVLSKDFKEIKDSGHRFEFKIQSLKVALKIFNGIHFIREFIYHSNGEIDEVDRSNVIKKTLNDEFRSVVEYTKVKGKKKEKLYK